MSFRWKVQIVFIEKNADGTWGEPVANSEAFEVETALDEPDLARDAADALYNANPRVQATPQWRIDGDYIRYANIERLD